MIYFVQNVDGGPIKIGYTANLKARHRALEKHYGVSLSILATTEGGRHEEREIHAQFRHLRLKGKGRRGCRPEQFRPDAELMEYIGQSASVDAHFEPPKAMGTTSKTAAVLLHADAIASARIVAAYRGQSMTDLISDILDPALAKMEREEVARRNKPPKKGREPK